MNIVVFSHDLPWPVIHGGRVDMYNRLRAFKDLGHHVFLVCWTSQRGEQVGFGVKHFAGLLDEVVCYERPAGFVKRAIELIKKAGLLFVQPNLVTHCSLSGGGFSKLQVRLTRFAPDIVFSDNIYAAKVGYRFASKMNRPFFIRSHNIEHIYIKTMALLSQTRSVKLHFLAMSANLKRYEFKMLRRADAVFDISHSDRQYWASQGLKNVYWMPPVYYGKQGVTPEAVEFANYFEVAYIGNLNSPNNVHGVFWFLREILPTLKLKYPTIKILIAGSNPVDKLRSYCSIFPEVTLAANPVDLSYLYGMSKVLINPVFFGSGVNIKAVELLYLDKPVVCTKKAVEGLPADFDRLFDLADTPDAFALRILEHLQKGLTLNSREEMRNLFSPSFFRSSIEVMSSFCESHNE